MIPVSAERRQTAGVSGREMLDVTVELDDAPVQIDLPDEFSETLAAAGLTENFERLAPSRRKEHVRAINEANAEETRQRRIAKAIEPVAATSRAGK